MNNCNNIDKNMECFKQFWDEYISSWFCNPNIYKKGDVFLDGLSMLLSDLMPEPYLGNPNKGCCSIAILNFNPGYNGDTKEYNKIKSIFSGQDGKKYSDVALRFPYIQDQEGLSEECQKFQNFKGTKWWKNRCTWLDHLVCASHINNNENLLPFALELCPWHSKNWYSKRFIEALENKELKDFVDKHVIKPYIGAISNSLCGFGVCVKKSFGQLLSIFDFEDITSSFPNKKLIQNEGIKLIKSKQRYYRIYKHKEQGTIVLNTWHEGGNHTPSIDFWPKERDIIQYIVNELIQK